MGEKNWKEMMKTEEIGFLGDIPIVTKNIVLFSGQSMAGKTASCLHIMDSAIKMGKIVLYYDTETKSIIERAEPNLFKIFYNKNSKQYDKFFNYQKSLKNWKKDIEKIKPDLVIIDSLYIPFVEEFPEQRRRARMIKEFLLEFRSVMWAQGMGAVITVPTGRIVDDGVAKQVALGGEGVKYLADVKIMIQFTNKGNNDAEIGQPRLFVVDRNYKYAFEIGEAGMLTQIK